MEWSHLFGNPGFIPQEARRFREKTCTLFSTHHLRIPLEQPFPKPPEHSFQTKGHNTTNTCAYSAKSHDLADSAASLSLHLISMLGFFFFGWGSLVFQEEHLYSWPYIPKATCKLHLTAHARKP